MTSLYNIFEQCNTILGGKAEPQEVIQTVKNNYAIVAKNLFYEGRQYDLSELSGSFIYTFKDNTPILDEDTDTYYINTPSSYVDLPHQLGINSIGWMKGGEFAMIGSSGWEIFKGLKSAVMGGKQVYQIENSNTGDSRIYFPKMIESDFVVGNETKKIKIKLAVALDDVDVDLPLNISPNIVEQIVNMTVAKYAPQPLKMPDKLS